VEVVTHRFTVAARRLIRERHPDTNLPLEEAGRRLKRGQFGYFKYVYPPERLAEAEALFSSLTHRLLPGATFDYIV
jgi:spore photoproduct lyase